MGEPVIAGKTPSVLEVEPGIYQWCQCGKSQKQPYCDGSHSGTGFGPMAVEIKEKKKVAFCNCKRTAKPPYCDGTHSKL